MSHAKNKLSTATCLLAASAFFWGAGCVLQVRAAGDHDHDHHHHTAVSVDVKRSVAHYTIPNVVLTRQDGTKADFVSEVESGKAVILAFIYTSCTAVCPVTSQILAQTQQMLGRDADKVRIMSVSIDPEHDTPARLLAYSQKFEAKTGWHHYTGSPQDIITVQKAFQAFRGDKMNHVPLILLKPGGGNTWVRLEGFPSAKQVLAEYAGLHSTVAVR